MKAELALATVLKALHRTEVNDVDVATSSIGAADEEVIRLEVDLDGNMSRSIVIIDLIIFVIVVGEFALL